MTKAEIQQLVAQKARAYGLDERIGLAQIKQESGFNPRAVGPPTRFGTAKGVAQFIDSTAREYGITDPFDPEQALDGWARYMVDLLRRFNGRYDLALAGYNGGPNRQSLIQAAGTGGPFPAANLPAETRNYVATILRNAGTGASDSLAAPAKSGIGAASVPTGVSAVGAIILIGLIAVAARN